MADETIAAGRVAQLEAENDALRKDLTTSRLNHEILNANIATLKGLASQLAAQLSEVSAQHAALLERREADTLKATRDAARQISDVRAEYELRLAELRSELVALQDRSTRAAQDALDQRARTDEHMRRLVASKDAIIAELAQRFEAVQEGLRPGPRGVGTAQGSQLDTLRSPLRAPTRVGGAGHFPAPIVTSPVTSPRVRDGVAWNAAGVVAGPVTARKLTGALTASGECR
jgi:hypothetical protein